MPPSQQLHPPPPPRGGDAVWSDAIEQYVRDHGPTEMGTLGHAVERPPGASRRMKVLLKSCPQRFTLETHSGTGIIVHLAAAAQPSSATAEPHRFNDASLHTMYRTLVLLHQRYRTSTWPVSRAQLGQVVTRRLSETLWQMKQGKYVNVTGVSNLTWNVPRIQDALAKMPAELKATVEHDASPAAAEPAEQQVQPSKGSANGLQPEGAGEQQQASSLLEQYPPQLIDNEEKLRAVVAAEAAFAAPYTQEIVAIDCEGVPERLDLIQVATSSGVFIFDSLVLGASTVCRALLPLLSSTCVKLLHDLHKDACALVILGGVATHDLVNLLDTQLAAEHLYGELHIGFNGLLQMLSCPMHPTKCAMHAKMQRSESYWSRRPLSKEDIAYAALDAVMLLEAWPELDSRIGYNRAKLIEASVERATFAASNDGNRSITFDLKNDYALASSELLKATRPEDAFLFTKLVPEVDTETILNLLPRDLRAKFQGVQQSWFGSNVWAPSWLGSEHQIRADQETIPFDRLSDLVIDIGRRPQCWVSSSRVFLSSEESRLGTPDDVKFVEGQVGNFGSDRRAGMDGKLHRISAIVNRDQRVSGLTIRVGRSVRGNADMMIDLLLGSDKSILVLGEPGSGKTTIVREAARRVAERSNVVIVDTSNEIAGDGMVPHSCIGLARRIMVPSLDQQSSVMIECVQNHTPHVMIIDEIGRPQEVKAARTVKQRGVRIIASAHGDLRRLIKNGELNGLVGGVEHVVMGDAMAKEEAQKRGGGREVSKVKAQRGGEPTFEAIVEVRRGVLHEWRIVVDTAAAVDAILAGGGYKAEERKRDCVTGAVSVELVRNA